MQVTLQLPEVEWRSSSRGWFATRPGGKGQREVRELTDCTGDDTHTFSVVFVFTCFTMMSASDLSNCTRHNRTDRRKSGEHA